MKRSIFAVFACMILFSAILIAQADYSNPKSVAQTFLNMCLEGKRLEAGQEFATETSSGELEILIKSMVMKDMPLENKDCKYEIVDCNVDAKNGKAKCTISRVCSKQKKNLNGHLFLIKINEKWLVDYQFKRDRYF